MALAYIGLGSNIGERELFINSAIKTLITNYPVTLVKKSTIAETKPVDYVQQPDFLNQIILIETELSPPGLFEALQAIEQKTGRSKTFSKGPREIDLDILLYDDLIYTDSKLVIPHPGITKRKFILEHLVELDESITEPETGKRYSEYLQD